MVVKAFKSCKTRKKGVETINTNSLFTQYLIGEKKSGKSDQILGVVTKFFPDQNFPRLFFTPDQTFPRLFCHRLKHLPDFFVPDQYFYPTFLTQTKFFQ